MLKLIWMTDPHFNAEGDVLGHDPRARLRAAIEHVNTHHSEAEICLISGDMVEDPLAENYGALRSELDALSMPYMPMMGNHDRRALLRDHLPLPADTMADFVQYSIATPHGSLLCLDTNKEGTAAGEFCATRMDWLQTTLQKAGNAPVFLFMHHPPMDLGLPILDPDKMQDGAAFLDLISAYPSVKHLFIGHVHRPITGTIRGIPFATMRSVLFQAPPPRPEWDWSTFKPAKEAPQIGILSIQNGDVTLQFDQFCGLETGTRPD